jgi:hypothetical protein
LLNRAVPDELYVPNRSTDRAAPTQADPTGLISPTIDGELTSYFEWLGAGSYEAHDVAGAMHRSERQPPVVRCIGFGFDANHLYIRVDGHGGMLHALTDGREVSVAFTAPAEGRLVVRSVDGRLLSAFVDPGGSGTATAGSDRSRGASVAAGGILEIAVPLDALGARAGDAIAFYVTVGHGQVEVEHHPADQPIQIAVPDASFAARLWSA